MTHAELCRPLCYFMVAHTTGTLNLSEKKIYELAERLERDGFKVIFGDRTGLISSFKFVGKAPRDLRETASTTFFPTSLDISLTANGLILIFAFGWYTGMDIPAGEDMEIEPLKPALKYLLRKLKEVVGGEVHAKIISGIRKCFFEHPGAYIGHF